MWFFSVYFASWLYIEKMHIKFFSDMINGCYIRFCDPCRRRRVDDFEGPRRKRPRGDFEREGMCTVVFIHEENM
jgi:hypothetical protein